MKWLIYISLSVCRLFRKRYHAKSWILKYELFIPKLTPQTSRSIKITHGSHPRFVRTSTFFPVFSSPAATIEVVGNTGKVSEKECDFPDCRTRARQMSYNSDV
jgi:hypothetical protein